MRVDDREDEAFPWARASNVALFAAIACTALAVQRYRTFHNDTFDLAFYTRILWGMGHGDLYQPLTNSHVYGLHASWILYPLALLGRWAPIVPLLLLTQAVAICAAAIPLARLAARRLRAPLAADCALFAYLLYPPVITAATYEFHPSALALFPLAFALDAWDRGRLRDGALALAVASLCREDAALVSSLAGLSLAIDRDPRRRRWGLAVCALAGLYFAHYVFLVAPKYLPRRGSLALHFGALGATPSAIARSLLTHPIAAIASVSSAARWLYPARLLAPVAFLPLLSPRWLLPALAPIAINFLSAWPTATQIRSHYSLLAVPFVIAAAIHGAARLVDARHALAPPTERPTGRKMLALCAFAVLCAATIAQRRGGATPLSRLWRAEAFTRDARAQDLERIARDVRPGAFVVAPDALLPHVAARPLFQRLGAWTRDADDLVLRIDHRIRFDGTQTLWRTHEEVLVRNVLREGRYGLVRAEATHLLLRRGVSPRAFGEGRYVAFSSDEWTQARHVDVDASLSLASWRIEPIAPHQSAITLWLLARRRWPHDLGLELGWGPIERREDRDDPSRTHAFVPFDGLLNPIHVRPGEIARTRVVVRASQGELLAHGLWFGARRVDGSRLHAEAPHWVRLDARDAITRLLPQGGDSRPARGSSTPPVR